MKDLNQLAIFARVAQTRSFSAAAGQLELSPSAVSKAISRLEDELGIRLLHRSTRSVKPTNEGLEFLERCRSILADVEEAESSVTGVMRQPRGRLRIVLPVGLGYKVIVPALRKAALRYPELIFDCELTDRNPDLIHEGLDCAVVTGPLADQRLVARKLYDLRFFACASPEYLERHGEPRTPDELDQQRCIAYVHPESGGKYREWRFQRNGLVFSKLVSGQVNVNYGLSMLDACVAGEGIVMLSTFLLDEARRRGQLKIVLEDYATPGPPIWLVYPDRRNLSTRLRVFSDIVSGLFAPVPAWDRWMHEARVRD